MRDRLLQALRDVAIQTPAEPLTVCRVAKVAGVDENTVLQHLGPAENYAALLSYQQAQSVPVSADTRERILQSAARVFGCKGFQRATLDEVAADAGMTKGAIYWHFKSKNDLFFALLDHRFQEHTGPLLGDVEDTLEAAKAGPSCDLMEQMFLSGIRRCTEDADWPRLYFECVAQTRDPEVRSRFAAFYQKGWAMSADITERMKAAGLAPPEADPQTMAVFWGALFDGLVLAWLINPGLDMESLADRIFRILWRGIAPDNLRDAD